MLNSSPLIRSTFLLQDYEGRYLRIGHCYDQFMDDKFDGAVGIPDINYVASHFGDEEGDAAYVIRADVEPPEGPDGFITIPDILRVARTFGLCVDTGHFYYNGDGVRVRKWASESSGPFSERTEYTWDVGAGLPVVLQESIFDGSGVPLDTIYYVYGLDLISNIKASGQTFYLYDGLGSTTGLADNTGSLTDTYEYDVFGVVRNSSGTSAQPFRFTGEQHDLDVSNELYYLRARYYDPALGRFWTTDPWPGSVLAPQTMTPYTYVGGNPVNFIDPTGFCATGQVPIGRVPTPPPTITPTPFGSSSAPLIGGETSCHTLLQGSAGGSFVGFVFRHAKQVSATVWSGVTSDCFIGIVKVGAVLVVVGTTGGTALALIGSGGLATGSIGSLATSGTAIAGLSVASTGVNSTILALRVGGAAVTGGRQFASCFS